MDFITAQRYPGGIEKFLFEKVMNIINHKNQAYIADKFENLPESAVDNDIGFILEIDFENKTYKISTYRFVNGVWKLET